MNIIVYISNIAIPLIILIAIYYGIRDKINIFDTFTDGVKKGFKIVIDIFPILIGLFLAVETLSSSGIFDRIGNFFENNIKFINIPKEIIPLVLIRPISGTASLAMLETILQKYGTDTFIGNMSSILIGSTETIIYVVSLYMGVVEVKNNKKIIFGTICVYIFSISIGVIICQMMA